MSQRVSGTEAEFVLDLNASFGVSIELGDFTIQELMEGRSEAKPDGDILYLDLDLALPSGARLNDIIDAVSRIASSPITCGLFRSISIPPMRFNSRKLSAKAPHSSHRPAIPGGSLVWERP